MGDDDGVGIVRGEKKDVENTPPLRHGRREKETPNKIKMISIKSCVILVQIA